MKYKIFNVLLLSSSLLGLTSTQAVSTEIQVSPAQISFLGLFSNMNRIQNTVATPVTQTNSSADPFAAFFGNVNRAPNATSSPVAQTSSSPNPFADFFNNVNRSPNATSSPVAQTSSSLNPFADFFNNVNRSPNATSSPVAQTSSSPNPFADFFSKANRAPNTTSSPVAQTSSSANPFAAFLSGINQPASQTDMSARASNAMNTALKTPNLAGFIFNSAQNTSTKNGVVVKDEAAYQAKVTDIFGNTTVIQEGSPNLLDGFNQNPVTATPAVITPSANPFAKFLGNIQVVQKPATITPTAADPFQNILDNYYKPSQAPIVVTKAISGDFFENSSKLKAQILEAKVKTILTNLFQKSEQEIETLLTDNDQYRALSTIWPTLNNDQKVENTIDYLFTIPQIKNATQINFTSSELAAIKEESVGFVQKSNVILPNNLEDFVDNFETNIRNIFARNGENLDNIL